MKKYRRVMKAVRDIPWAILPEKLEQVIEFLNEKCDGVELTEREIAARIGDNRRPSVVSAGSVAIIPIYGVLSYRVNLLSDISGATSTELVARDIAAAAKDPNVTAIMLDINSPGGSAFGLAEIADQILAARETKRVIAMVNPMAASAAYFIASAASEIVVTPSGMVGSIGVFMAHEDVSKAEELAGVKTTLISAGKYKVEGNQYEPLSESARAAIQETTDKYYAMFIDYVARGRGVKASDVRAGFGEGRMVMAAEAVKAGMADRVASYDATLGRLLLKGARGVGDRTALTTIRDVEGYLRDAGIFSNAEAKRMASVCFERRDPPRDVAADEVQPEPAMDEEGRAVLLRFIGQVRRNTPQEG